jgi:hypothetical protein
MKGHTKAQRKFSVGEYNTYSSNEQKRVGQTEKKILISVCPCMFEIDLKAKNTQI